MSANSDLDAALKYHNGTKHSYISLREHPHFLDWQNKPLLFKIYPTLEVMRLERNLRQTGVSALSAISAGSEAGTEQVIPDVEALAQLLFLSAGVTKSKKFPGGEIFFRAAACTGALYEIELYIVCGDLPGLAAGVYHFGAAEFGLRLLRSGDFRDVLVKATAGEEHVARSPVLVICTGTYWRNAWKYRSRTYRHFGWDNGTILANMTAVAASLGLPAHIVVGFDDADVNRLIDVDPAHEVAFSLVTVGRTTTPPAALPKTIDPLGLAVMPYSKEEVDYPAMRQIHEASSLAAEQLIAWRHSRAAPLQPATASPASRDLHTPDERKWPADSIEQVILRRGSTRQFTRDPITYAQLSTVLDAATRSINSDIEPSAGTFINDIYVLINNVVGLDPGAYFFDPLRKQLDLIKPGSYRDEAGYLGLEQQLPADAAVNVFFLADLNAVLTRLGNRGYRAVQLEAGILGGKMYLAAYAQRLGATGLTFYDDDVVNFFSPHARGKSAIFLVALGKASKLAIGS